jgi:phosphoglycerol transferase MdoB-like AlkP superfamily enzyme
MPIPRTVLRTGLPVLSTALFYALYYLVSAWQFDVRIVPAAVPFDYLLQLLIAYILLAVARRVWVFVLLQGLLMGVLYIGNAVKIAFFGGPIVPDDAYALRSLLLILEGWQFIAVAVPLAAIAALMIFNVTLRHWSSYLAMAVLILFGVTLLYQPATLLRPLDHYFGNSVWDQRSNYLYRGATLYTLQEGARYFAHARVPPDRERALRAASNLLDPLQKVVASATFEPRNVHIVLLESFWDPVLLKRANYNRDPLAPGFRRLWKRADHAQALSPVFGGYTANAEFEILCGFPVVEDQVKFERQLLNDAPCLPQLLARRGYRTLASHPNVPAFWNRINAYRRIGFQTYWSRQDFVLDDMNREFLGDASLYRQVLEKITPALDSGQPLLNYIVTYSGHWNYPLNASRPLRITSPSAVEEVSSYANTVYYQSRELMVFLAQLRERDPDAIILVLGDHLPFLGKNFAGYVDSGVLAAKRSQFSADMLRFFVSTPMIVIDGQRGALKTGTLPMYEIPAVLLELLHITEPTIMDYTRAPQGMQVRPLAGLHINLFETGEVELCREPPFSAACQTSARWLEQVRTVDDDLFIGEQFTRDPVQGVLPAVPDNSEHELLQQEL